jgi:hypothetical protein
VVDASVIVKWLLPDADGEEHVDQALLLLKDFENERIEILQRPRAQPSPFRYPLSRRRFRV